MLKCDEKWLVVMKLCYDGSLRWPKRVAILHSVKSLGGQGPQSNSTFCKEHDLLFILCEEWWVSTLPHSHNVGKKGHANVILADMNPG